MRAVDIIEKKRDSKELSEEEIIFLLGGYLSGEVKDYHMSSFLMAVYFNGMSEKELSIFTREMINSGDTFEKFDNGIFMVDKHSTGGVGDKTTIVLSPILSALSIGTIKLSGRGLGFTGGTIDKFESISGFSFPEEKLGLERVIKSSRIGIMGYSDTMVPLDKKLYSLRDVTATVPSIPLIASSIMSKKLAVKSDAIILDVKVGNGAFMKDISSAEELAKTMLDIGKSFGRKVVAVISEMEEPLGRYIGNSLEIFEAIETLKGRGEEKFNELIYTLASEAMLLKGDIKNIEDGKELVKGVIESGEALKELIKYVEACDGDINSINISKNIYEIKSEKSGYISNIEAEKIGKSAMYLGAGRAKKGEKIFHEVGIELLKKVGDYIEVGETLVKVYYKENLIEEDIIETIELIKSSFYYSDEKVDKREIILKIVE